MEYKLPECPNYIVRYLEDTKPTRYSGDNRASSLKFSMETDLTSNRYVDVLQINNKVFDFFKENFDEITSDLSEIEKKYAKYKFNDSFKTFKQLIYNYDCVLFSKFEEFEMSIDSDGELSFDWYKFNTLINITISNNQIYFVGSNDFFSQDFHLPINQHSVNILNETFEALNS